MAAAVAKKEPTTPATTPASASAGVIALAPVKRDPNAKVKRPGALRFTAEKKKEFLEHYSTGMTVAEASALVGVSYVTVFTHADEDEEFGRAYRRVMERNTDALEDLLMLMARKGNVAALFGTLKARRPERWRERMDISNADGSLLKPLADAIKRVNGVGGGAEAK